MPTWLSTTISWLLGFETTSRIDDAQVSLGAAWAQAPEAPVWLFLGSVGLLAIAIFFYLALQDRGSVGVRLTLGILRGLALVLVFITLADPILRVTRSSDHEPLVYVLIDGTDSMAIEDQLPDDERSKLDAAVGGAPAKGVPNQPNSRAVASRMDYVKALLARPENNALARMIQEKNYRLEIFLFDGNNTNQLRKLAAGSGQSFDPSKLADQLTTTGQVTALGTILTDLGRQYHSGNLAGVILISDFANNAGPAPNGGAYLSPAKQLGVPIYAVGVGARQASDVAAFVQPPPKMKKAEKDQITVKVTQTGSTGQTATVRLYGRRLERSATEGPGEPFLIGEQRVTFRSNVEYVRFDYTPLDAGRLELIAKVDPLPGETVEENNQSIREVNVIDDYLRLMYVAYEPNWEWRFIKEVFHRDKLVGMRGFRTFLRSSDPKVRQTNALFLPALTPKRSDFFANDVIFLGDMPARDLSPRFCDMTKEFVSKFGGSLVVMAGPRFGPGEIANTSLKDMLPVVVDPNLRIRDQREFSLDIGPLAGDYGFMRLGDATSRQEIEQEWRKHLGPLAWYQPVKRLTADGTALASHPTDLCEDGKTPQPIVAIKRYGAGEVVYIGFDETWRLRRKFGEQYYRQFWSQLIYRLGMSHALGSQKRFVVRTDRQQYQAEDTVTLSVEAYDSDFEPLREDKIPGGTLTATLARPGRGSEASQETTINVPLLREGEFEARIPVYAAGEYALRVKDPVTDKYSEIRFTVASQSAERRSAVRGTDTQAQIAQESGGRAYELAEFAKLTDELKLDKKVEKQTRNRPLWSTPLWFILAVGLLLGEWFFRKQVNLK